jgi:hypothetical protein
MFSLRYWLDLLLQPIRGLFCAPGRLLSSGKRVFGLSLPARAALLVAIVLIVCVVVSLVVFSGTPNRLFWISKIQARYYLPTLALLVIVIPLLVYHVLRMWLEGNVSPYADIDAAWKAGVAELERRNLDLSQTPLFLVLGSSGEEQERALFDAARLSLNVREVPVGPAALHWYANPDGIYIVCSGVGSLSRIAALGRAAAAAPGRTIPEAPAPEPGGLYKTFVGDPAAQARASVVEPPSAPAAPPPPAEPGSSDGLRKTMMISSDVLSKLKMGAAAPVAEQRMVQLPPEEAIQQDRRLEYLCHLIRRARQPLCPANGILTVLPYQVIRRSDREAGGVQQAVTRDLARIRKVFQLRCAVTAVLGGLEEEAGFRELVRRVGRDKAAQNRFGKGFSLGNPPDGDRLAALCAHACGAFEDWVYSLFRETGGLSKPGNSRLYALLCRVRHDVRARLEMLLAAAYSSDPQSVGDGEPLFFSGCYFAATGVTEDRQAFVKAVLEKLPQEQAELQWTKEALRQDDRLQTIAQVIFALDFMGLASLAAMVIYRVAMS